MIKTKNTLSMKVVAMVLAITMIIGTIPTGIATVFANESGAVAKIEGKEYESLEAALADVPVGNSKETPTEATVIELCQDTEHSFDVGISNGTEPKNIELRLNDNTLTLKPAVGSTGTVSNGIRVLAYSKLTITNGNIICSSEEDDNVKTGIANYGELVLDSVNVQSGALTQYTINNRGALTLKGDTVVQNGQVAPNDYSDSTGLVAITNDPYDMYYSTPVEATITCDSADVTVGNIQIERYELANKNEKGNNVLNISEGSFGSIVIPAEDSDTGIDVVGNISGGSFEAATGAELQNVMDLTVAGVAYQTPENAVTIKLTDNVENGFDVGTSKGTAPKYFVLDLNQKTITLRPAVGSKGTVSSGIRVLAYSKLEIKNGNVVCSDAVEDNIKTGIANYGTLVLDSVNVQSGALTIYTINNRGELTLSGTTTVENGQVAQDDYSNGSTTVAITNDPYTLYYTNDAVINCDSKDVIVGNLQLETYGSAGNVKLNISEGTFGEVVAPEVSDNDEVEIFGNITGGVFANDISTYVATNYKASYDSATDTYTVGQKVAQENFGFETPVPLDQWVGETYTNKVTGVQGTGTTTYSVVVGEDVATVNATTGEVTFLKLGTVTIQADNTGDSEYLSASANYTVTSVKKEQETFKFATTGPVEVDWALNGTYQNTVTGGSGDGDVSYEILENNGVATIDAKTGVVTFIKAGEITIQATKASDDKYFSIDTTYILKINKIAQDELKLEGDSVITYSPEWQDVIEVSGGSGNGNYKFELPSDYSEYAEINTNTGAIKTKRYGTIKVLVSKEGDDCYNATEAREVVIEIERAKQSGFQFAVEQPSAITYGDNNNSFKNIASGGQTVNVPTYAISGDAATIDEATGELTIVKAGTVTVTATKLGDNCYETVVATYTLEIKHAKQSFAFKNGQEISETYGITEYVNEIVDEAGTGAITFKITSGDDIGATIGENTGVITFEDSELKVGEISVLATKAGNECYEALELGYTLKISYLTVGSDITPTFSGDTKNNSGWYTGDVTFTAPTGYQISMANTLDASNVWDDSVTYDTEGVNDVNIYLMNAEGYITDAITFEDIKIDKKSPEKLEIKYSTSVLDEIIEGITFGFYKAPVTVTVTAEDETAGVEYFELTYEKKNGLPDEDYVSDVNTDTYTTEELTAVPDEEDKSVFTATHTIPAQARGSVSVNVVDRAGNGSAKADGKVIVVDDKVPELIDVQYTFTDGQYREYNDVYYTQGETKVTFTIDEANFDVANKPVVTVNAESKETTWTQTEGTDKWVGEITLTGNGDYAIQVTFADKSGNEMGTYEKTVHIDNEKPKFDVTYDNNEARNDNNYKADRTATVVITEHNFKADEVILTVTAEDINGDSVDIASKAYADYAKNPANWNTDGDVHTLNTEGMKFDIEAIYHVKLEYTDLAENVGEAYEVEFVVDKTAAKNIKIEYSTSVLDEIIEGITFGFYNAPVTITVTAEDETAGVEYFKLTYEKKNGLPDESYVSDVNTDTYTTEELTAVPDEEDKSVFTATHKILAQARGSVSVEVMDRAGNDSAQADARMTVVDELSPKINVTYVAQDENTKVHYVNENLEDIDTVEEFKTKGYQAYYNGDVMTTIQIDEANFFEGKKTVDENGDDGIIHEVGILLVKTYDDGSEQSVEYLPEGSVPKYPDADNTQDIEWKQNNDVYSFEIPYEEEADYQLVVEYADFSQHNATVSADDTEQVEDAKTYTSKIITVDKTTPIVSVEYGNKDVKNTVGDREYFNATQTATITVEEHNFRADDFEATVIAENVFGEDVSVENFAQTLKKRENWKDDGNTHTIEIKYPVDANYTFDYKYEDLAQNSAEEYEEDMFTVDTVSPEVVNITYKEKVTDAIINNLTFNYFGTNVQVTVTIKDETAGVSKFDYEGLLDSDISAKNKAVIQTTIETKEIVQREGTNLFVVKFQIPKEALTELNSFRGTVKVNAYDYSGNTVQKHDATRLVVDKIAPTCQVTFDQPVNEVEGVSYYDKAFTATIVIDEANFYAEDVVINVNGSRVMPTDWTQTPGTDIWTSHVSFTAENDYILTVDYTDRSGNVMTHYESNQRTLDTTEPVINVSNIKHESANNQETIGFTLTITDKNMALANVKPSATAVIREGDNSTNYTYKTVTIDLGTPAVSTNANGETVYTYTVQNLEIDGYYSLVCTVVDHANHSVSNIGSVGTNDRGVAVETVNFSVNRGGSVFWIETVHNDKYSDTTFNNELDGAYANDEVTVKLHEVNVDRVDELEADDKRTVLTLNDGNDSKAIELVENSNGNGNYDRNVLIGEGGWYETIYTLGNDQFAKDGTYSLNIITYDKAENSNVNTKNEEGTIKFVVDRTNPVVTTNVKSKQIIDAEEYTVELTIAEVNLDESTLVVKLEGKEVDWTKVSNNTYQFTLDEAQWANFPRLSQDFEIEVKDLAGNSADVYQREDITVTDDVIIQVAAYMINRPVLLGATGAGIFALAGIIIFFIVWKKRKKDEEA